MPERNYPPRRRRRRTNYKPIIFTLVIVLLMVSFVALMLHMTGSEPENKTTEPSAELTQPSTEPSTEVTEPSTVPTEPPVTVVGNATIGATGDMLMHMPCVNPAKQSDATSDLTPYSTHFEEYVRAVDYAVANLETTLAGTGNGYPYHGYPNFNCPDGIVTSLQEVGFDMPRTANNHTYDTGTTGFFRTQQVLKEHGMDYTGTRASEEDDNYLIKQIDGVNIGMICYTYETNADPDKVDLNGGADFKDNEKNLINVFMKKDVATFSQNLERDIANMRADGAEAIVLYIHWGEEYQIKQNAQQTAMAQAACDLGVDVIVGGHPHVIQPIDLLTSTTDENHKTVCLYSTGNALSNQRREHMNLKTGHTEDGIFFTFSFAKYSDGTVRLENVDVLPLWINLYYSSVTKRNVYDILPLDSGVEDWKTQMDLTDASLAKAKASYDRTMAIVGAGLQEVQEYLAGLPEIE